MTDEAIEAPTADEAETLNAVIVYRVKGKDGDIRCYAEPVGDVLPTEVLTILELAGHEFRTRVGLG